MKKYRGCKEDSDKVIFDLPIPPEKDADGKVIRTEENFYRCPVVYMDSRTTETLFMINMLNTHGVLPYEGSLMSQPYWFIQAFRYVLNFEGYIKKVRKEMIREILKNG